MKYCRFCKQDFRRDNAAKDCCVECEIGITAFWLETCERAEAKMLTTGKLEGAHYAAATEILAEMRRASE